MAWTVFLDRDGTLVPNRHYPVHPDELVPYAGAVQALEALGRAGASLVVVSNQSAVGRGLLDKAGLKAMDQRLKSLFASAPLTASFYCPHHPDDACSCRKPRPELIYRGLKATGARAADCFLVGDSASDMEAGKKAGVRTVLVLSGNGRRDRERVLRRDWADKVTGNLVTAAAWILKQRKA